MLDDKHLSIVYSKAPILIRLGFLSVDRQHIPKCCGLLSFVISHLQTIALLLNNSRLFLPNKNDGIDAVVKRYLKIFGFADFFSYTNSTSVLIWAGIMLVYCLHFVTILLYLSIKLKRQEIIPDFIKKYWSVMNYFHPLVIFYPIHTFNLRVLQGCKLGTFIDSITMPSILLFYANIIINFLLAFLSTRFFHVVIKTRDSLSCKNNTIRTGDLLSKTVTPIIWIFADDNKFMQVSTIINGVIDCLRRDFALFYYLPYYSTEVLHLNALMQGATTTLALVTLATRLISYSTLNIGQSFSEISWIILIPIMSKLYSSLLRRILGHIISAKIPSLSLHYAIQKKYLLKYLLKIRKPPTSETKIFNLHYFVFRGVLSQSANSSVFDESQINNNSLQDMRTSYGEILSRYPKSHIAKVTLASHYIKKENAYLLANNLIEEVSKDSPSFSVRVSLSLLRFDLQKKTFLQYSQKEDQNLNVLHYVQTTTLNAQLKQQIKHQMRKQLEFWSNFSSSKPDMGTLTGLALNVVQEKKQIQKSWKELNKIRPCTFYSSPLLYGMYASLANNDSGEGEKIIDQYHSDILNSSKLLEVDELNNDTMMATDTVQIRMSGSRTKIGYILDCSSNISEVYGWKKEFLTKQPIVTIMPPYYQQKHDKFLLNHFNTGKTKMLNNTSILPVMGSDGFMKSSRVHIKMHPFVEQGISYVAILRTIKESKRTILVRKDGTIDAMSKNFAIDMNLISRRPLDIFGVCPGFRDVNLTFNKKALAIINENSTQKELSLSDTSTLTSLWNRQGRSMSQKSSLNPIDLMDTQAQRTYGLFTKGSKLAFYPEANHKSRPIFYNVQIVTRIHGKDFIKLLSLDRIANEDAETIIMKKESETPSFPKIESKDQEKPQTSIEKNFKIDESESSVKMTIPEEFNDYNNLKKNDIEDKDPRIRIILNSNDSPPSKANQTNFQIPAKNGHKTQDSKTESPQEQNFLRKKLQKLREKLDKEAHHHNEGSLTGSTLSRGKKAQSLVTKALDTTIYRTPAILFCIGFFIFNVIILSLQITESLSIIQLIDDIKSKTNVMANGAFRLNSLISLGMYARSWLQAMQGSIPEEVSESFAVIYSAYAQDASKFNTLLRQQVSEIDPKYQAQWYVENVKMYDTSIYIGSHSNFDAAGVLIDHSTRFLVDQTSSNYTSTNFDNVQFILDNLYNDFLLSSLTATSLLLTDVDDTLSNTKTKITVLYIFVVVGIVGFFFIVAIYFYHLKNNSKRFANLLFRLNLQDIQQLQTVLQQFIHSLDTNIHNLEEINEQYDPREAAKKPAATEKITFRRPSMSNLTKRQILVFLKLLPVFIAAILGTLIYFLSTRDVLSQLEQQQVQIQTSLSEIIEQTLTITGFIELVCTNATSTIMNYPVEEYFLASLEDLKDINQLIDVFRDSDGELSFEEKAVFFSFPCRDFANYGLEFSDFLVASCEELSYGLEETSFTTLNAQLYSSLTTYYSQFITSDRTTEDVGDIFGDSSDQFLALALVSPAMCTILYKTTLVDFEDQTKSSRQSEIVFLVLTIVGTVTGVIFVWFFVMKKILMLESYNKTILKLVPIRLILANQHLKQYVIQNSNHVLDNVTSFL